ncbi:uncharacterized protein LOC135842372 isoform X1 [Planococcus citri]|uniref:uncharacterized protein LOC135842372 isoform X1 n=1 Tax=Planococcus citri TaxID=170843 RepID=UPI0031F99350
MLKTLLLGYYFILLTSNVNILGEQFQACDSSSDEEDLNAVKEDLLQFQQALENAQPNEEFNIPANMKLPCKTQHVAQITWPSGAHVLSGGIVNFDDIQERPKVIWPCHGSKFYGLVFANMDAVIEAARKYDINDSAWREYLWFMYNIPGNRINEGVEVKPYRTPSIEKGGSCRIVVAVHEQSQRANLENVHNSEMRADGAFFEVFKTFNGSLAAGNMFTVVRE